LTDLSASFGLKFKESIRESVPKELMRLEKGGIVQLRLMYKSRKKQKLDVKVQPFSYKFSLQSHLFAFK